MGRFATCLAFTFLGLWIHGHAQSPILQSDAGWHSTYVKRSLPLASRTNGPDTLSISPQNPFFDDFSSGEKRVSTSRWFHITGERSTPVISKQEALQPPSVGAVVFDGLNEYGLPYETTSLDRGKADVLMTHYLDLAPYAPADQVSLRFFLQAGGYGEIPEASDSFLVYFLTPTDTVRTYVATGGSSTPFQQVVIPINQPDYFVTQFQVMFENSGSLNGHLDLWHLDYVRIEFNRSAQALDYPDVAPVRLTSLPLFPYTAIPLQQYQASPTSMQGFSVEINSLSSNNVSADLTGKISDPVYGNAFVPVFEQSNFLTLTPGQRSTSTFPAFSDQNFSGIGIYEFMVSLPPNADAQPENNSLTERFRLDSLMAYDDGEADGSFGLNVPLGFASEFNLQTPDSMTAVWISFVPTVNYNPVSTQAIYMDERSFRFRIWDDPHPDSILYEQVRDMKVLYDSVPNYFIRYALTNTQAVPTKIWVGLQQLDSYPIGVGYDFSYDHDSYTYWDSLGNWINTRLGGTLMIRPEFKNTFPVPLSISEEQLAEEGFEIYPNPVVGKTLNISRPEGQYGSGKYTGILLDLSGRTLFQFQQFLSPGESLSRQLPDNLTPGLYLWQHVFQSPGGPLRFSREKILIQPN
ncbi:MAG: hypothetical protein AAFR61_27845 [Bacteroidota bacterium]